MLQRYLRRRHRALKRRLRRLAILEDRTQSKYHARSRIGRPHEDRSRDLEAYLSNRCLRRDREPRADSARPFAHSPDSEVTELAVSDDLRLDASAVIANDNRVIPSVDDVDHQMRR